MRARVTSCEDNDVCVSEPDRKIHNNGDNMETSISAAVILTNIFRQKVRVIEARSRHEMPFSKLCVILLVQKC